MSALRGFTSLTVHDVPSLSAVEERIAKDRILVISKTYCPYCKRAKKLLEEKKLEFEVVELDERSDGELLQEALARRAGGHSTVPMVWFGTKFVGGASDLERSIRSGALDAVIEDELPGRLSARA